MLFQEIADGVSNDISDFFAIPPFLSDACEVGFHLIGDTNFDLTGEGHGYAE